MPSDEWLQRPVLSGQPAAVGHGTPAPTSTGRPRGAAAAAGFLCLSARKFPSLLLLHYACPAVGCANVRASGTAAQSPGSRGYIAAAPRTGRHAPAWRPVIAGPRLHPMLGLPPHARPAGCNRRLSRGPSPTTEQASARPTVMHPGPMQGLKDGGPVAHGRDSTAVGPTVAPSLCLAHPASCGPSASRLSPSPATTTTHTNPTPSASPSLTGWAH